MKRAFSYAVCLALSLICAPGLVFAESGGAMSGDKGVVAIAAALAIALAAFSGTASQSRAISAGLEAIGRNPAASGKVFTPMIVGLVLIESLVILSFVIAIKLAGVVTGG